MRAIGSLAMTELGLGCTNFGERTGVRVPDGSRVARAAGCLLLAVAAVLAAAGGVAGQDSIPDWHVAQPERPTVATHAYVVAPGVVEIEAGVQAQRPADAAETDIPFVVKLGLAPRTQLELQWGWTHRRFAPIPAPPGLPSAIQQEPANGLIDLALALKYRVLKDAPVLANFSVIPSLKLPTGSAESGTGTGTTDLGLLLCSSRTRGRFSLDLNAGATRRSGDGSNAPRTATLLTASASADLGHGWGFGAELFDLPGTSGPSGAPPQIGMTIGPTRAVRPWLVLDAGVVANVHGLAANSFIAGVTWNIGRIPGWPGER